MTKKLLGLLIVALFCISALNATTVAATCNLTTGAGSNSASGSVSSTNPVNNANFTCNAFTVPVGQTLTSVQLKIFNDYSLGIDQTAFPGGSKIVNFTYTVTNFNVNSLTTSVSGSNGSAQEGVSSDAGGIVSQTPNLGECSLLSTNTVSCVDPQGIVGNGVNQFLSFSVTGSSNWVSGGMQTGGSNGFNVTAFFTYSPTQVTPEPASLLMIGSGLIGLAAIGRRKWRA